MSCIRLAVCAGVAALALAAAAAADDREALKPVVEKAFRAAGGEKLRELKGWSVTETATADGTTTVVRRYARMPNHYRYEVGPSPGRPVRILVISGDKGWAVQKGDLTEVSAADLPYFKQEFFWLFAQIVGPRLLADPDSVLTKLPEVKIGDRQAVGIQMDRKDFGTHRLYLDKETGLLLKVTKDFKATDGQTHAEAAGITFGDFRADGGVTVPHKKRTRFGASESAELRLEYRLAGKPDAKYFGRPDPKEAPDPEAEKRPAFVAEFLAVKKQIDAKEREVEAAIQAAPDPGGAAVEFMRSWSATVKPAAEKVMVAVRPHTAEPEAVEALVWVVNQARGSGLDDEAARLLGKHHLTCKETVELTYRSKHGPFKWVEPLLRAQLAAVDLPAADRPRLLYALARVKQTRSELPGMLADESANLRVLWENFYGKDGVAELLKIDAAREVDEAARLYAELADKYGTQKMVGDTTYGEFARSAVFEMRHLAVGKAAPEIDGQDIDGAKFKLSDYRGKVVLLVFWGTWCGPCMAAVPHERAIVERLKGRPFALVGVNSDTEMAKLKARVAKEGITWRSFWCGEKGTLGTIPLAWNVTGWPTTYVLDAKGVIRAKHLNGKELDRAIDRLLGESGVKQ